MGARHRRDGSGLVAAVVYVLCAVYLHAVSSLLAWTALPVLAGLTPTLIVSESMTPSISAGDLVLTGRSGADDLLPGQVITFTDPARSERLLTHRIASVNDDGTYRTRGDANRDEDSTEVAPDAVRGVGKLVVPVLGMPVIWVRSGLWLPIVLWALGTTVAVAYLAVYRRVRPGLWGWTSRLGEAPPPTPAKRPRPQRRTWEAPVPNHLPRRVATAGLVLAVVIAGLVVPRMNSAEAAWADKTRNSNNQFAAAGSFCPLVGTQTLTPAADTVIHSDGSASAGVNPELYVRSRNRANVRALLRFDLPAAASCTVTAKLRLNFSAVNATRVLQVFNAPAAWAETTATWAAMPAPAATPVRNVTPATGWLEIPVTDHVLAMYSGTNNGFLLKDQTESEGGNTGNTQTFASRNAVDTTLWPQLVLTFGATAARPPAPTGLAATALSASRIALTWTDTATDETSYTVQRSPSGAGTWTTVATLAADAASHTDTGLASETTYDYRVRSTNAQGDSAWSNIASATTEATPAAPAAPTGLAVTVAQVNSLTVTWTDASLDEDGFTIESSPASAGTWTQAGTVTADVTNFEVTGLTANTSYDVRVRATNNGGSSSWSNVATASTTTCASEPARTLTATEDTAISEQAPATNYGGDPLNFGVRSAPAANARSLVKFNLAALPLGCAVATANLKVNVTSSTAGRTVQVWRLATPWTETTATWTSMSNGAPATTGSGISLPGSVGVLNWVVTTHVVEMLASGNHGFLLRDAADNAGTASTQAMTPRETATPPQLVLTFN